MPTLNLSPEQASYIEWTKRTYIDYLFYAPLIVTPTGVLLNSAAIVVFSRNKFRNSTMGFYNTVRKPYF